jgi:hypothetical protein
MEEAREKIELFRTYYLVCFRSFDQDPYSPTHLEPVNMYMVVFREGILSVSSARCSRILHPHGSFFVVPLPPHSSPAKRSTANQAAPGLHQRHVRLDFICAHRRYHGRVRATYPEHRVRGRQH